MTRYTCDGCGKEMPTTTEGFWHLTHSDSFPSNQSARQVCWSCYYLIFPSADVKLTGGKS